MGIVPVRVIPDKYKEMITNIIAISPNISDYYSSQYQLQWIQECQTEDTYQYICNHLITLVVEELDDMGISVSESLDTILEDLDTTTILISLRKIFDVKTFCNFYSKASEEVRASLMSILENSPIDETLSTITHTLCDNFNNDDLQNILKYEGYYISDVQFKPYLTELINLTERVLNNESTIDENILSLTSNYIDYLATHKKEVEHATTSILNIYPELDKKYIDDKLTTYDLDLLSSDNIKFCSIYFNKNDVSSLWRSSLFNTHMKTHVHHIDYYLHNNRDYPNNTQLALVVAEFFAMATDKQRDPKTLIENIIKNVDMPDTMSSLMSAYIRVIPPYLQGAD